MPIMIAYSTEISGSAHLATEVKASLGTAHYSYGFVTQRFVNAFVEARIPAHFVDHPEKFKHPRSYHDLLGVPPDDVVHICFRSTENFRLMAGCRNICHFAWEFPKLKRASAPGESITTNQVHMLRLMDEIWVPCEYTRSVLEFYGLDNVHVVPTPICQRNLPDRLAFERALGHIGPIPTVSLAVSSNYSGPANAALALSAMRPVAEIVPPRAPDGGPAGRIFLTVCNPGDLRKNLLNMIEGFQLATDTEGQDIFIIKLIVQNTANFRTETLDKHILHLLKTAGAFCDDRIVIISDYLTDIEMTALYSIADFYICASHCEGFNLPILEAMAMGVVPIATANTAMADYIDASIALVIEERPFISPVLGMAGDVAGETYALGVASRFDIARSIVAARRLSAEAWQDRSDAAGKCVRERYRSDLIMEIIGRRIPELGLGSRATTDRALVG